MIFYFFQKRVSEILKNKKTLVFKLILPSILILPLFFVPVNVFLMAGAITFFVVLFGFFSAGESLGQERVRGVLKKIAVAPVSSSSAVLGEIFAHSLFGFIQFLPIIILVLIKVPANLTLPISLAYLLSFFCTIISANTLGVILVPILPELRTTVFLIMLFPLMVFSGVFVPLLSNTQMTIAKILPPSFLYQSTLLIFSQESIFSLEEVIIFSLLSTLFIIVLACALSKEIIR